MVDQRLVRARENYQKDTNRNPPTAILGDQNGVIVDPDLPLTNVFIRLSTSLGLSARRSVILPASVATTLRLMPGEPVHLGYDGNRSLVITGAATKGSASIGLGPVAIAQMKGTGSTPQRYIETLRLVAKSGMLASLKGWNPIVGGVYTEFYVTDIDWTDHVPSSGQMRYCLVAVLSDLSGVELIDSTPRAITDFPLGEADIQECLDEMSAGSMAVWALKLIGDLSEVPQSYIDAVGNTKDLRPLFSPPGSGGGGFYQTVQDTFSDLTQRHKLNFIGFSISDDPANDSTDIQSTGGGGGSQVYLNRAMMFHIAAIATVGNTLVWDQTNLQAYQNSSSSSDRFTNGFLLPAGVYSFNVLGNKADNRGIVDWYLDGSLIVSGEDWYNGSQSNGFIFTHSSITVTGDGHHKLEGRVNGKNGSSSNYFITLWQYWFEPSSD